MHASLPPTCREKDAGAGASDTVHVCAHDTLVLRTHGIIRRSFHHQPGPYTQRIGVSCYWRCAIYSSFAKMNESNTGKYLEEQDVFSSLGAPGSLAYLQVVAGRMICTRTDDAESEVTQASSHGSPVQWPSSRQDTRDLPPCS
jgi:hypothetical protein